MPDPAAISLTDMLPLRLTRDELALFWRVSTRTIERWSAQGLCPAPICIGGRVLFRREDVLAWEQAQITRAQPDVAQD
ncbi:MAG: helix-turn-helix transcriptional regulator [Cypionkella sp.]